MCTLYNCLKLNVSDASVHLGFENVKLSEKKWRCLDIATFITLQGSQITRWSVNAQSLQHTVTKQPHNAKDSTRKLYLTVLTWFLKGILNQDTAHTTQCLIKFSNKSEFQWNAFTMHSLPSDTSIHTLFTI